MRGFQQGVAAGSLDGPGRVNPADLGGRGQPGGLEQHGRVPGVRSVLFSDQVFEVGLGVSLMALPHERPRLLNGLFWCRYVVGPRGSSEAECQHGGSQRDAGNGRG